jgi:hypothetical protein
MVVVATIKLSCSNCLDAGYYDIDISEAKPPQQAVELQGREREGLM